MKREAVFVILCLPALALSQSGWQVRMNGLPRDAHFLRTSLTDSQTIWIATNGLVWKSLDAGRSWVTANPLPMNSRDAHALAALSPNTALVATTTGKIFKTTDGGVTWTTAFDDPTRTNFFNDMEMFDDSTGYAIGDAPNGSSPPGFVRTRNGGRTWTFVNNNLPLGAYQYAGRTDFINPQVGWTYLGNIGLYKTTDGGVTWNQMSSAIPGFNTLFFVNDSLGFHTKIANEQVLGVYKTTDSGKTWRRALSATGLVEFVRSAPGGKRLWTGGLDVYCSNDMGETWEMQISQQNIPGCGSKYLHGASFYNDAIGAVVGDCVVLYTSTGGLITSVDEPQETPSSFGLKQNYPNPWNALTTIQFELPASAHVTLKIFDEIGQEIATIFNGEKPVGKHEVKWNAGQLPSGVYFYRLQAGELISARKLVLVH